MKIVTRTNQTFVLTYEDLKEAFADYLQKLTGETLPANNRMFIQADDNRGRSLTMTVIIEGDLTSEEVGHKGGVAAIERPAPGGQA
jgi:hypothetical protein